MKFRTKSYEKRNFDGRCYKLLLVCASGIVKLFSRLERCAFYGPKKLSNYAFFPSPAYTLRRCNRSSQGLVVFLLSFVSGYYPRCDCISVCHQTLELIGNM